MVWGSFCTTGCEFTRLLAILQQLSLSAVRHHFQKAVRYLHEDWEQEDTVGCLHALDFHPSLATVGAHRVPTGQKLKYEKPVLQIIGEFLMIYNEVSHAETCL